MSHAPQLFDFEGEKLSAKEIAERYPAYTVYMIRDACRTGATCLADLQQRHAEGLARRKAGGMKATERSGWRGQRACSTIRG